MKIIRWFLILLISLMVAACAHPINISPVSSPKREEVKLINKHVAYVMTDEMRNMSVTTNGGGGDKVSYSPYRDIEKGIRDALRAVYQDVSVISNIKSVSQDGSIDLVYVPLITTTSNSDSMLTWPPTQFFINLECSVTDINGKQVANIRVSGNGAAEFSEFKSDFGLAGRRATTSLSDMLVKEIQSNPALH